MAEVRRRRCCRAHGTSTLADRVPCTGKAIDIALLLATHASLASAGTQAVELAALREARPRRAIDSRDVIGQAKAS